MAVAEPDSVFAEQPDIGDPPMENVTDPVGVPPSGLVTVAVNSTVSLNPAGLSVGAIRPCSDTLTDQCSGRVTDAADGPDRP